MTEPSETRNEPHVLRRPTFWILAAVVTIFVISGLSSVVSTAGTVGLVAAILVAGLLAISALRAR